MDGSGYRKHALPHGVWPDFSANLDILRGTAVLLVLLGHVLDVVVSRHHLQGWGDCIGCCGRLGVLLFFVHTSLVLNFSLARLDASGWRLFRAFLVRRIFRLYPLSIFCVLLVVALKVPRTPLGHYVAYSWGTVLANITLTTDVADFPVVLGPLWTLPIELQMYLVMPLAFMLLGSARSPRVALGLWLLASAIAWMQPNLGRRLTSIDFAPCFIAGTVAYTLSGLYTRRIAAFLWMPCLLALLYMIVAVQSAVPDGISNMPLEWMFCLLLGLVIPLFHDSTPAAVNFVANRIARYSYGIYLFHFIAIWTGCTVFGGLPEPLQWVTALGLLVVMSVGSYHLLEKPAIDFGARLGSMTRPGLEQTQKMGL
jgi:peptidoglycan/LPS O-acetylase OafA/YrhL